MHWCTSLWRGVHMCVRAHTERRGYQIPENRSYWQFWTVGYQSWKPNSREHIHWIMYLASLYEYSFEMSVLLPLLSFPFLLSICVISEVPQMSGYPWWMIIIMRVYGRQSAALSMWVGQVLTWFSILPWPRWWVICYGNSPTSVCLCSAP